MSFKLFLIYSSVGQFGWRSKTILVGGLSINICVKLLFILANGLWGDDV